MKKIDEINDWFSRDDIDLEEALEKLKQGKDLIQKCKTRLAEIENEFKELKVDLDELPKSEELEPDDRGNSGDQDDLDDELPF